MRGDRPTVWLTDDDARRLRRCARALADGRVTLRSIEDGVWLDQLLDRVGYTPPEPPIAVVEAPPQ